MVPVSFRATRLFFFIKLFYQKLSVYGEYVKLEHILLRKEPDEGSEGSQPSELQFQNKAEKWFTKYGKKTVFVAQLLPVIRTYISLHSGILQIGYLPFVILTFLGGLVWSTVLVYLGMTFGKNWPIIAVYFKKFDLAITIILVAGLAFFIYDKIKKFKEISKE